MKNTPFFRGLSYKIFSLLGKILCRKFLKNKIQKVQTAEKAFSANIFSTKYGVQKKRKGAGNGKIYLQESRKKVSFSQGLPIAKSVKRKEKGLMREKWGNTLISFRNKKKNFSSCSMKTLSGEKDHVDHIPPMIKFIQNADKEEFSRKESEHFSREEIYGVIREYMEENIPSESV